MKRYIGIIGSTGSVGRAALNLMIKVIKIKEVEILVGVRDKKKLKDISNINVEKLDIFNEEELISFCEKCNVLINCAGPSSKILDKIALVCLKTKTNYVDVSGDLNLINRLNKLNKEFESDDLFCIHSAGVYPGLSEVFPLYLASLYNPSMMKVYFSGNSNISHNAAIDIVKSIQFDEGKGMYYLRNSVLEKLDKFKIEEMLPSPIGNAFCFPIINEAFEHCMKKKNIEEIYFYNTFKCQEIIMCMMNIKALEKYKKDDEVNLSAKELEDAFKNNIKSDLEYTAFYTFMKTDKNILKKQLLYEGSWNALTGEVGALTGIGVLEGKANLCGVKALYNIFKENWIIETLIKLGRIRVKNESMEAFNENKEI